jgi:hypothetical protein
MGKSGRDRVAEGRQKKGGSTVGCARRPDDLRIFYPLDINSFKPLIPYFIF